MLSPRLKEIAAAVPIGAHVADVGTDHAYLPIYLTEEGIASSVIATDIREMPLAVARKNVAASGLKGISLRLCDGLSEVAPDEVDTVIIAGMGGDTAAHILSSAPWLKDKSKLIILQSMSSTEELRRFLAAEGYSVLKESCVEDSGRIYSVMTVRYGGRPREISLFEALTGKITPGDKVSEKYLSSLACALIKKAEGTAKRADMAKETALTLDAVEQIHLLLGGKNAF